MDFVTFTSNAIESLAWPALIGYVLYLFQEPVSVIIQSLKRIKYKDLEIEIDEANETGDPELDILISNLLVKSHSFKWLRRNTPLTETDHQFEEIIKDNPNLFKAIKIKRFDKNGNRIQPGNPGIRYIGKK